MVPIQSILIAAISHAAQPAAAARGAVYIYWGVALWKGSEVHLKARFEKGMQVRRRHALQ